MATCCATGREAVTGSPSTPAGKPLTRLATHIVGLDTILYGGLLVGGLYMVAGTPGAGKTVLVNHIAYEHAAAGGSVAYFTVFGETHSRLLAHVGQFAFFRPELIGSGVSYYSGYDTVRQEGLSALRQLIEKRMREGGVSLVVIDGVPLDLAAPGTMNNPEINDFCHGLQTAAELTKCTVLCTVPTTGDVWSSHAFLFVDGAFDLLRSNHQAIVIRSLEVRKFRGSTYRVATHPFTITAEGITMLP